MIERRVERHVINRGNKYFSLLDHYCFLAKNLYNHATYLVRQHLFSTGKWLRYGDLDKIMRANVDYPDYTNMCCAVAAQQTLRYVDRAWSSYFNAHKDWKENPDKYTGEPKLPKYKDKVKGRSPIYLTNQICVINNNGVIRFPKAFNGFTVQMKGYTYDSFVKFKQCRILAQGNHVVIELVYDMEVKDSTQTDNYRYLGIDLGVDNLAAVSNNIGAPFYLIDGKGLKSINQYWNQLSAKAQSDLMCSRKRMDRKTSNKLQKVAFKRNQKINDYLHKASRWIVDFAIKNDINTIVIGKNKQWKQKCNLGKKTNRKFVQLPHARFIDMIMYKGAQSGINVICVEESYTSKTSFLDREDPCKHTKYKGKRTNRGLFKTSAGYKVNADSNGALQIIKKHTYYEVNDWNATRILLQNPIRINVS